MSDESDSEKHYYNCSEDDDESRESDSDGANHGLLDLEASEGSSDPESEADQFSDDGNYTEYYTFPKFMQLPPEIREMVWAAFCPDLRPEPRVFELGLHTVVSPPGAFNLPEVVHGIVAGPQIESQTEPMRVVMAVHRESRALGLKSAPHEITLSRGEFMRYHQERDILFIAWNEEILLRGIALRIQELGIEAQNLAFPSRLAQEYADDLVDFMYLLPQTRRVFILDEHDDLYSNYSEREYNWAAAETIHKYRLDMEEEDEAGLADPISRIYCWPDLDNHRDFAEKCVVPSDDDNQWWIETTSECRRRLQAPLENSRELNDDDLPDEEKTEAIERLQNIDVWPMVRFNFEDGLDCLHELENKDRAVPYKLSRWNRVYDDSEDQYESEFIDDDPLPDPVDDSDDDSTPWDVHDPIVHNLVQQLFQTPRSFDNSSDIDELPPANFSSDEELDEPDHVTLPSDSEDESESQTRATRPKRRVVATYSDESATETEQSPQPSKRRSRVALSDSENDDDEGPSDTEPVRGANRRRRAIPIDSEDEQEQDDDADAPQTSRSKRRRGRAVTIDSDDDDDEEEMQQPSRTKKSRGRVVQEESDEEGDDGESDSQEGGAKTKDSGSSDDEEQSSSDDDEDDDPPPPKRMSLAKRLRMEGKQAQPRRMRDDDDSEADGVNGDGYGYSDDQEDEVDRSDSDMMTGAAGWDEGGGIESEEEY